MKALRWNTWSGDLTTWENVVDKLNEEGVDYLYIGSDSQVKGRMVKYITAVAVLITGEDGMGHGGYGWIQTDHQRAFFKSKGAGIKTRVTYKDRIYRETWKSIGVAWDFCRDLALEPQDIEIHCDVNENPKYVSSNIAQEIRGLIEGQGFKCELKPYSWCSMEVADRYSK